MDMFWKKLVAGIAAVVIPTVLGVILLGTSLLFPLVGGFIEVFLIGTFAIFFAAFAYGFGQVVCEKVFGWFY